MKRTLRSRHSASPTVDDSVGKRKRAETDSPRPSKKSNIKQQGSDSEDEQRPPMKNSQNSDVCSACGFCGRFICCDACPNAFHFTCVDPPMDVSDVENLSGNWYCAECEHKRQQRKNNGSAKSLMKAKMQQRPVPALFGSLIEDLNTRIPTVYKPPKTIAKFFDGVSMDKYGQYVDTSVVKSSRSSRSDMYDDRKLKDKNDNFICCFRCRKTAVHNHRMISCDYCPLNWHMDCLDPPMTSLPNSARKWMCPSHPDHIMPRIRQPHKARTVDCSSSVPNNGVVTIIDDDADDDDDEDDCKPTILSTPSTSPTTPEDEEEDDTGDEQSDSIIKYSDVTYRLPASTIKLDFFSHIESMRSSAGSSSRNETPPTKQEMKDWLEGLTSFQAQLASYVEKELNTSPSMEDHCGLRMLAHAAADDMPEPDRPK